MADLDRKLLRTREAAILLGVSARSVRRLAAAGQLPGYRLPGGWRFPARDVLAVLRQQGVPDPERRLGRLLDGA